ncbi:GNAT family N-acetyltransferase [Pseudobutyrivibrio xylanivorans]|uniref:GNAT family N-acetyltransferase n=1 Tax=Pseudobutyrivibrio xylanivorans TaxID=185007 RepID=A0A5P6VUZ0_PSEXY|nr:GNAT family N-acetyltransferase [Pseudobutyrivibrio xylanivorans]QFJ55094.1 GNAT family N-acetyltransferase [Pseudobutyrivibrio xylanivorans]
MSSDKKYLFETERLGFRHWNEDDAEVLFSMAKEPEVGLPCGWPAHTNIEESVNVINNVFTNAENYCLCLKETGKPVGTADLMFHFDNDTECELGYWLGKEYWGQGLMPEACTELLRRAFEDLYVEKVWCGYYQGNEKSKRVQEKLGFKYHDTQEKVKLQLLDEVRTNIMNLMTKEDWLKLVNC